MLVREVMASDVPAVAVDTTVDAVAQIMADLDVGALPVGSEGGRPEGIITSGDILLRVVAPRRDPRVTPVGEVMSTRLFSCNDEDEVEEVLRVMERHQVRRMPVTDREGRLLGMVAFEDIRRAQSRQGAGGKARTD